MAVTEHELEEKAKGLRVTLGDVHSAIQHEFYFTGDQAVRGAGYRDPSIVSELSIPQSLKLLTFCTLVLKNGFTVTGTSACADPKNYDQDIGQRLAKEHAINQVWPLLDFELRSKLAEAERVFKS